MTVQDIKNRMPGYQAWNDPASIMADYAATGGVGKGNAPSNATTVAPTYSGTPGTAEQGRVDELTRALAETTRNMPQTADALRNTMLQNDPVTPALSGQYSDAIMQLYEHDQKLGEQFSNPQGNAYIEDPVARERAIQAARGPMVGNLGYLNQMIGTRRQVLGDAATRGMEIYKAGLAAQELELSAATKALERTISKQKETQDYNLKWASEFGGNVTNPYTGETKTTGGTTGKNTSDIWTKILAAPEVQTEQDVWNLINVNASAWRAAGVDVDQLWKWHKELVAKAVDSKYGKDFVGPISPNAGVGIKIPGVKLGATEGQKQLTDAEIKAGVQTGDSDQTRNQKVALAIKSEEDAKIKSFIDEALKKKWSQQQINDYIKSQGFDPAKYRTDVAKAKTYKGMLPDWIPLVGGL